MRDAHPGLFRAMVKMAGFSVINGLGMLLWPSRMPPWLPSSAVGVIAAAASIGVAAGAFARIRYADLAASSFVEPPPSRLTVVGRVSLAVLTTLYLAMSISLFIGWDPTPGAPGAVTQSLDRVLLYALAAGSAADMLREPVSNPVSARRKG